MTDTAYKTIVLKGDGIQKERLANAAITPGHLVEVMSTNKLRVHATAGGNCQKAFAVEDDLQGNPIGTAYVSGNKTLFKVMVPGSEVYAILADGQTAVIGSLLESAGDGTLQVHVPDAEDVDVDSSGNVVTVLSNQIVGVAMSALDLSGSSGADALVGSRLIVEVM